MLLAIVATVAGLLGSVRVAAAPPGGPVDLGPHPTLPHPIIHLTPPPLPFSSASPSASPGESTAPRLIPVLPRGSAGNALGHIQGWRVDKSLPPLPQPPPKLSQFLVKTGKGRFGVRPVMTGSAARMSQMMGAHGLRPMAGDGSTIILTGDQLNFFENDITLAYGTEIYLLCENMATTDKIDYVVFPPDGSGPYSTNQPPVYPNGVSVYNTNGNNACGAYGIFNLSTPFDNFQNTTNSVGVSYPGVWVVATYDRITGKYTSETNIIASSAVNFTTYSDVAESTPSLDFNQGSTIAVGASGLNPSHYYAVGWVYTSGSGQPCEYSVPSVGSGKKVVCFTGAATGVQAFSGNFEQWWNSASSPSTTSAPTGTYDVELYDTTTSEMIGHQQISIQPSTALWTLTPYSSSGATPPPSMPYSNIFASDGLTDQSVTGLAYAASGLPPTSNGHTLRLTISNPNGVVLTDPNNSVGYPIMNPNPAGTDSSGVFSQQVAFPYDSTELMAYGPTQNPFAPNVLTAQLYDTTLGTVIASKSFQILAYAANFAWASASIVNAAPGTGNTETVTVTNTGNQNYGTWNGDGINGIEIAPNKSFTEQVAAVSTTATDSAGNVWNIFNVGSGSSEKVFAEPQSLSAGANLPVGGTLSFQISIQISNGQCTSTPCYFDTMIRPRHGVAYSSASSVSNGLPVVANGVNASAIAATASWAVQSEASTANMAARVADYNHLAYILGTDNAPSTDTYTVNLTLNNASSPGGHNLMDVKIVMPAGLDMVANPPVLTSWPGSRQWVLWTNFNNSALGGANVIELTCQAQSKDSCGISPGTSGLFTIQFPLFTSSFAEQDTPMTANFDGGCSSCTNVSSYALTATSTTVNGIAGLANTDSMMLGGFSLNPNLMYMSFAPSTVGTGVATTATMVYNNTSTSQDPNPDYVDQLNLVFPSAINPSSITVPTGWVATQTSTNNWQIALCSAPTASTPCSTSETNAIAPGGSLSITLNYNSPGPPAGTYNVTWYARGANGGENTSGIATTASVTFSTTAASVKFTTVNGGSVSSGSEPKTGADATTSGSTFVYTITNTGSSSVTGATITIPNVTRGNTSGADSTGQYWQLTSAPTVSLGSGSGTSGTCNGTLNASQYTNPTSSANGSITLSGCNIPTNGVITITMVMKTPYLIGSDFLFSTNVTGSGTVAAQPAYSSSNAMLIVINGYLSILTPGNGSVGAGNLLTAATNSGATPSTSCTGCSITTGTPTTVDFGAFSGTFTTSDIVDASVLSDANSPNSWTLYISTSANPSNMLYTEVDSTRSTSATGLAYSNNSSYVLVPTTSPGLKLTTYTGTGRHYPSDTIQNFQVVTGGNTAAQTATITYTLVFN